MRVIGLRHGFRPAALAVFVLVLGTLVYVLDRPAELVPFFAPFSLAHLTLPLFGKFGQSLPTFTHVFAFSVLTGLLLSGTRRAALAACLSWFTLDTAFEVGQHAAVAGKLMACIPSGLESAPVLRHTRDYFMNGTFDPWDLLSIAVGAVAAYAVILWTAERQSKDA
ncbi:MAG: hypothetical protein OEM78_17150 [Gammaproteobacteria bacterium]|nr:hypothetical protein [Gammaproteobacteria bacterium]